MDHREMAEIVKARGDKILEEKRIRAVRIRRITTAVSSICAAAAVCFGVWHNSAVKKAMPDPSGVNIVTAASETNHDNVTATYVEDTKANVTATVSDKKIVTSAMSSTASQYSNTQKNEATAAYVSRTTYSNISSSTKLKTTAMTNTTNTSAAEPVTPQTKTESTTMVMTTVTTTSGGYSGIDGDNIVYMGKTYRITGRDFTDVELSELPNSQLPVPLNVSQGQVMQLKLYEIRGVSADYAVAALIDGQPVYTLCLGDYTPETMQSLFRDAALSRYWSVDSIYEGRNEVNDINVDAQQKVFDILLNLKDMNTVPNILPGNTLMKINLKSSLFGESTIVFTEKGYLSTYLGGYHNSYLLGREEIENIIESIKNEVM